VETSFTIMPGLNCGTVNPEAWPDLQRVIRPADAIVVNDDERAPRSPCSARSACPPARVVASLAAARKASLGPEDVLVLICTEGVAGSA
jgi:hypothetical protein